MEKRNRTIRIITFLMVIFLVASACRLTRSTDLTTPEEAQQIPQESVETLPAQTGQTILVPEYAALEGSLEALYEQVSPGVVSLQFTTTEGGGQGTGFVIDKEGHIVTNYHVASEATELEVHFPSGL